MLSYVAELHERSTRPPSSPFPYPWEEIGPGYCYGPAFGHWDIIHQVLDVLPAEPEHARMQLLNNLSAQREDGFLPAYIYRDGKLKIWHETAGHPPVWTVAVQKYYELTGSIDLISKCYEPLTRQIGWFESNRKVENGGFYYIDITDRFWESGVDEGVRFDDAPRCPATCVDATCHIYQLYDLALEWAGILGKDSKDYGRKAEELKLIICDELFDAETGFFHDAWTVGRPELRHLSYEGVWPLVTGAATPEQAAQVIDRNLLDPTRFLTKHPVPSVAICDPAFELRMWRGCAWNSMTHWMALGCVRYGRLDAAKVLMERALDQAASQFERTGTIWEFYHPLGGNPEDVRRKPHTPYNVPCRDYLGHNPLIAMTRIWAQGL